MSSLNTTIIAPLIRGLFLNVTGKPVVVTPVAPAAVAALARPGAAGDATSIVIELTAASLGEGGELDEAKTAAELKRLFAEKFAGTPAWKLELPAVVEVSLGGERLFLEVRGSAAAAELAGPSGDAAPFRIPAVATPSVAPALSTANSAAARSAVVAGKIALVTGGAQGFGAEIARGLAASGALVFIADLNLAGAAKLAEELMAADASVKAFPLGVNVTDEASVAAMFEAIAATTGGLDLIVSNAGVLKAGSVLDQDEKSFRFVTDVNYTGFFFMAKHGGRLFRRQWRTAPRWMTDIVQINSKSGLQGSNKNGAYAGSKFGSIGLVQSFALEFVQYGIKVNAICPGNFFDGPLWSDPKSGLFVQYLESGKVPGAKTVADVKAYYEAKVPMGRGALGADVMRALYYLVEQEYETGQALPVTGGQVMLN
ncbi:MAG: SDR family NAD(P)-dependent oxidoreductase [Spirochaetales bacterium]|jgi:sorbitol-6-phosphate 2-dehydrogenase